MQSNIPTRQPIALKPISKVQFEEKLNSIVQKIWTIQDRLCELKEFERQFEGIFVNLKKRTGSDCKITVLNDASLRAFRWDKYHVLLSDILSTYKNEIDTDNVAPLIKYCLHHLSISTETAGYIAKAFNRLFPNATDRMTPTENDIYDLIEYMTKLSREIKGVRHYFSHKYEEAAQKKYQKSLKDFSFDKIDTNTQSLFQIIKDIGLVFKDTSYASRSESYKTEISDQIDLILFGSIRGAIGRFYENESADQRYWVVREKYFDSEKLNEIISNLP